MISKRHPKTTRHLGAPKGWSSENGSCAGLAIADIGTPDLPLMQSVWEPTPEDIDYIKAGGLIVLTMVGETHPPVALSTWLPERD